MNTTWLVRERGETKSRAPVTQSSPLVSWPNTHSHVWFQEHRNGSLVSLWKVDIFVIWCLLNLEQLKGFFFPQCLFCYLANRLCESSFKFCHSWFVSTQASVGWCEMFHGLSGRVQSKPSPWNGVWKSFPLIKIELDPAISFRIIFVYTGYSLSWKITVRQSLHMSWFCFHCQT